MLTIPDLTAKNCNDVINTEISLGRVDIPGRVNNKITYHIKQNHYYVYKDNKPIYNSEFQRNAIDFYNQMNKKVDL